MSPISAIGLQAGRFDVDPNGLSRYSLRLELPKGRSEDSTPQLSLDYCQGASNGVAGAGWSLGGMSVIRRTPVTVTSTGIRRDSETTSTTDRFSHNGDELMAVSGSYGKPGATYKAEVDPTVTITERSGGFSASDGIGGIQAFGTTTDSQIRGSNGITINQWQLKQKVDLHGNSITYNYTATPTLASDHPLPLRSLSARNVTYIDTITYSGHEPTQQKGNRCVKFVYWERENPIVVTGHGDQIVYQHIIREIQILYTDVTGNDQIIRRYQLDYKKSSSTNSSFLTMITQIGSDGSKAMPTIFKYSSDSIAADTPVAFGPDTSALTVLPNTSHNCALLPLNVTGRGYSDLVVVRHDTNTKATSLKTFLATPRTDKRNSEIAIDWQESTDSGGTAALPDAASNRDFNPNFLVADLNGDGRMDIILPYPGSDGKLYISVSSSVGVGYNDYAQIETGEDWNDATRFVSLDCNGDGHADLVQIYQDNGFFNFRTFSSTYRDGRLTLDADSAVVSTTNVAYSETVTWLVSDVERTGAQSLIRIWSSVDDLGQQQLKATAFVTRHIEGKGLQFVELPTSLIGNYTEEERKNLSVLNCDINGDGAEDLVTCLTDIQVGSTDTDMNFTFSSYLSDGKGGFVQAGDPVKQNHVIQTTLSPMKQGQFHVTNLNGSDYPSLVYMYQEQSTKNWVCLATEGSCSGQTHGLIKSKIADSAQMPSGDVSLSSADLNGTSKAGWVAWSLTGDAFNVCPIYNHSTVPDLLTEIVDHKGLKTEVSYLPMSDPEVYQTSTRWDQPVLLEEHASLPGVVDPANPNDRHDFRKVTPVVGSSSYVVSSYTNRNEPTISSQTHSATVKKLYADARASLNRKGWQGFAKVSSTELSTGVITVESRHQQWPLTGAVFKTDLFGPLSDRPVFNKNYSGTTVSSLEASAVLYSSRQATYQIVPIKEESSTVYQVHQDSESIHYYDAGKAARSTQKRYEYNMIGNLVCESTWQEFATSSEKFYESHTRFAYATIKNIACIPSAKKVTAVASNRDVTKFQDGDLSFMQFAYNDRAILTAISEMSIEHAEMVTKSYEFDSYGNETRSTDALGLVTETLYDEHFHMYPVSVSAKGSGVDVVKYTAYDMRFGSPAVQMDDHGALLYSEFDAFGRVSGTGLLSRSGAGTFAGGLSTLISSSAFTPSLQKLSFTRITSISYPTALTKRRTVHETVNRTATVTEEFYDTSERVIQKTRKEGSRPSTYQFIMFDAAGNVILESPASFDDKCPSPDLCYRSAFDPLSRSVLESTPVVQSGVPASVKHTIYSNGGLTANTNHYVLTTSDPSFPLAGPFYAVTTTSAEIAGKLRTVSSTSDSNSTSTFSYDILGRMTSFTDPNNKTETRIYGSLGIGHEDPNQDGSVGVISMNNTYQNATSAADSVAIQRHHDRGGNLLSETDAMGQVTSYKNDARGRVRERTGWDGRKTLFEYASGLQGSLLTSVATTDGSGKLESRHAYTYDEHGRPIEVELTLAKGDQYKSSYSFNAQNQQVGKTLADGSKIAYTYEGSLLRTASITAQDGKSWDITGHLEDYSALDSLVTCSLSSSNANAGATRLITTPIILNTSYDAATNLPVAQAFSASGKEVIREVYSFNAQRQMTRTHEFYSGKNTSYTYKSRRLVQSQSDAQPARDYTYDASGNLTQKDGMSIGYTATSATGTKDGQGVYNASYDAAGRLKERVVNGKKSSYTYDSFGKMSSSTDHAAGTTTHYTSDSEGRTLLKEWSDGTREIVLGKELSLVIKPDGARTVRRKLYGADRLLAAITTVQQASNVTAEPTTSAEVFFASPKGDISHVFDGSGNLTRTKTYDDFGVETVSANAGVSSAEAAGSREGYEGKQFDVSNSLLDFGSRWYDPFIGRFTTPDNIWDTSGLAGKQDSMNRYAFEFNDPINHIDPSGHWGSSWASSIRDFFSSNTPWHVWAGLGIGILLGVGAIALMIGTGGAACPIMAALGPALGSAVLGGLTSALIGGAIAALTYTWANRHEKEWSTFAKGFGATVGIAMGVGFATGFFGGALQSASTISKLTSASGRLFGKGFVGVLKSKFLANTVTFGGKVLLNAFGGMFEGAANRAVHNSWTGSDDPLIDKESGKDFGLSIVKGLFLGAAGAGAARAADKAVGKLVDKAITKDWGGWGSTGGGWMLGM